MADIATVLAALRVEELIEIKALGPKGHLGRHLIDALDRAAGGPGAGRGFYILDGTVNHTGGQNYILRNDVSEQIFQAETA
ncbi:hypothetical protein AL755_13550 [Arthrobacter sp. ERGS1:01]|uniref:hypothetical protein n=1 Tax=Arthrobacter sp. ERGS1:01 TaxID=1704044 RepID=UPI0006B55E8D|nr:hypothetical protein [Arthrobacter sp. ERGS1:01]ALE06243.1 hypothetical protein AL755_13550 [Arthrobacter sp. ERGS1:01]